MLKRIIAVSVVLVMCTPFAYAWNAESFIGLDQVQTMQEEVNDTIYSVHPDTNVLKSSRPMMMAAAPAVEEGETVTKVTGEDFFSRLSISGDNLGYTLVAHGYQPPFTIGVGSTAITVPGYSLVEWNPRPMKSFTLARYPYNGRYEVVVFGGFSFPSDYGSNGGYLSSVDDLWFGPVDTPLGSGDYTAMRYYDLAFDLSNFPSFNSFSFSGSPIRFHLDFSRNSFTEYFAYYYGGSIELIVNDSVVHTFSVSDTGYFTLDDYIYSSSSPVSSIIFRVYSPFFSGSLSIPDSGLSGNFRSLFSFPLDLSFSVLIENDVLNGSNDQGQNAVNDLNSIESDWTGQMNSNFNSLNVANFSYPNELVASFALVTGIFNDLWNIMGAFNIVYIFPLTLGVTLVVIGRLSKSSGGQSSSVDKRGDSSA